jgi:hypothetical protein
MVYIKSLDKRIFPYFIKPYKEELFSSWLCRLSINHKIKPQSFVLNYFGREVPIWNRDIDLFPPNKLISFIEQHVPIEKKQINDLFLNSYESFAFEKIGVKAAYTMNVLPLGINHRKRKRFGLQFCPKCLRSNDPYYKKSWRLLTSILCIECNEYLKDRCPKCDSPIAFHRVNISDNTSIMKFKEINYCSICSYNLSLAYSENTPTSLEINYQKYINKTISDGFNFHSNYSFSYINVLLHLSQKLRSGSKKNRFRKAIINSSFKSFSVINGEIRYWDILERIKTLPVIYSILNDQNNLKNILEFNNVGRSYLDQENTLPYWFINNMYLK